MMDGVLALQAEAFELPEFAKVTRVVNRLQDMYKEMQENTMDAYSESYSAHSNSYGIGF